MSNVVPEDLYRDALAGRINRRELVRRGAALGLSLPVIAGLLAACGGDDDDTDSEATSTGGSGSDSTATTEGTSSSGGSTASPASGTDSGSSTPSGEVVISQGNDINTLDPHNTATINTDLSVISHLYDSLITRTADLTLQPLAATEWEATSDTTWQFKLRDDITFPDATKLDASVVKWNMDRVTNEENQLRMRAWFLLVSETRVVDDTTVEFVTSEPYPALADQLSMFYLLSPTWAEEHDPASEASGSGPYDFVEWIKDDHVTLQVKSEHWGDPMPFETVVFRSVPENSSRVSGLLAGDFQIITTVQPPDFPRINDSGRATAQSIPSTRTAFVKFNTLTPPFDNKTIRQALNYAIDKESLATALFEGMNVEPSPGQILTDAYFGFNPDLEAYPYDPDRARQMLEEAGWTSGTEVEFSVPIGRYLLGQELTQAIAGQLQEVGVNAKVTELPFSVFMDNWLLENNLTPLAYITFAFPTLDADGLLTFFEPGNQYAYWEDENFATVIRNARSTVDRDQRLELYKEATSIMFDEAPVIFLFPQPATGATLNDIDWAVRPDDWVRVWDHKAES